MKTLPVFSAIMMVIVVKYGLLNFFGEKFIHGPAFLDPFYMDMYSGIGFRFRDIDNIHRDYDWRKQHFLMVIGDWPQRNLEEYGGLILNLSAGIKLGMRF